MRTTSYAEFRKKLAATIDQVSADHEPVIIIRGKGKASAVLMSLEDFAAYEETDHLLRSPTNAQRLFSAVEALSQGQGDVRPLAE
jgi:antitoxin YefM